MPIHQVGKSDQNTVLIFLFLFPPQQVEHLCQYPKSQAEADAGKGPSIINDDDIIVIIVIAIVTFT